MIPQQWNVHLVIVASFLVSLLLAIYPLPLEWRWWRPEFVLLVAIYWLGVFPLTFSLFFLAFVGLFQDLLEGTPFGQHSLSMIIVAYICIVSFQRVRNFSLLLESCWVFVLVGLAQLPGNWVQTMAGQSLSGPVFLAPALSSALLWPLLRLWLDRLSRHYRIN